MSSKYQKKDPELWDAINWTCANAPDNRDLGSLALRENQNLRDLTLAPASSVPQGPDYIDLLVYWRDFQQSH